MSDQDYQARVPPGWDAALDVTAVLAGEGVVMAGAGPRLAVLAEAAAEALAEGATLLAPAVAARTVDLVGREGSDLILGGGGRLTSAFVSARLEGARQIALVVCTVGAGVERRASDLVKADPVAGLAWDGLGTAAVDLLARVVCREIATESRRRGDRATCAMHPGMADWPLADGQRLIFGVVRPDPEVVRLTESAQMQPGKSLSLALGIGPDVDERDEGCAVCEAAPRCAWSRRSMGETVHDPSLEARGRRFAT